MLKNEYLCFSYPNKLPFCHLIGFLGGLGKTGGYNIMDYWHMKYSNDDSVLLPTGNQIPYCRSWSRTDVLAWKIGMTLTRHLIEPCLDCQGALFSAISHCLFRE